MSETTIELPVSGMTCASCARSIELALDKVAAVQSSTVSFPLRSVRVTYDDSIVTRDQIARVIRSVGFDVVESSTPGKLSEAKQNAERLVQQRQWRRFILGTVLTLPIFVISMGRDFGLLGQWASANWVNWFLWILATPVQFVVGAEYYSNAWKALKNRFASMDVLVSIGATTAYLYSVWIVLALTFDLHHWGHHVYFETSATIITLILLGRIVETGAQRRTGAAIEKLVGLQAQTARVLRNLTEVDLPINELQLGDIVVVRPGGRVPVDGQVRNGSSTIDESMLTGESLPINKQKGDNVFAGTMNQQGMLHVSVNSLSSDSLLSQIVAQVEKAQATKAPIQKLADQVSNVFVPIVLAVAAVTFLVWAWVIGDYETGIIRMITVLIISCPCAMGLATPLAVMVGMGRGAEMGVLFKSSEALQTMRLVNHLILDKTGTVTTGKLTVTDTIAVVDSPESEQRLLRLAAAVESGSEHPMAQAIVSHVAQRLGNERDRVVPNSSNRFSEATGNIGTATGIQSRLKDIEAFEAIPGCGAQARVDGGLVRIGTDRWLRENGVELPPLLVDTADRLQRQAKSVLWVSQESQILGLIALADTAKPTAAAAIAELKAMGMGLSLLTGDNRRTALAIAQQVGIDSVEAEVLPSQKAEKVIELQDRLQDTDTIGDSHGRRNTRQKNCVAMVGDGINDAPALAQADIGIAIGTGTDIAIESADVTLINGDLLGLPKALRLSRATMRVIKQNLFWAFAYNVLLIPVAAGVLAGFVFLPIYLRQLHPIMGAMAMVLSDLVIVVNALRLRKITLR